MKVAELEGNALDKAVMRGLLDHFIGAPLNDETSEMVHAFVDELMQGRPQFHPSRDWAQGGPIIERERINLLKFDDPEQPWVAVIHNADEHWIDTTWFDEDWKGATPLVAAMRAYVASKFGDEVPDPEKPL